MDLKLKPWSIILVLIRSQAIIDQQLIENRGLTN